MNEKLTVSKLLDDEKLFLNSVPKENHRTCDQ